LTSWVEHNKQHSERLRKWAEKAQNAESDLIYHRVLQAPEELKKVNEQLSWGLIETQKTR
jgi:hypothetical protein